MCCVWAEFVCSDERLLCNQLLMHNAWTHMGWLTLGHALKASSYFAYQYAHVSFDVRHNLLSFSIAFAEYLGDFRLRLWVIAFMLPGLSRREGLAFSHPTSTLIFRGPFFSFCILGTRFRHSNSQSCSSPAEV